VRENAGVSEAYTLHRGTTPLLVSVPHAGTEIPADVAAQLVPRALSTEDADWHLDRLYAFAKDLGASLLVARVARYVVDLNRPADDTPMYPGANNTELCPTRFFSGEPLCAVGRPPDDAEVRRRVAAFWRPYHDALGAELDRLRAEHGRAMLLDGHSIQAELPWLFDGRLPDLNLGTASGASCAPALRARLASVLAEQARGHTYVIDGRFKGGYITRHYGRPAEDIHAVQMEMGFHCYLTPPHAYDETRAANVLPVLRSLAGTLIGWQP
jgi:N-formylglutamate deformylase